MTPPPDLIECANCDCWFTGASLDEVFYHGTAGCCRDAANASPPAARDSEDRYYF